MPQVWPWKDQKKKKNKTPENNKCQLGCRVIRVFVTVGRKRKWCRHYGKQYGTYSHSWAYNYHVIQQFYFWVYTQKNWKEGCKEIFVYPVHSTIIYNSQKMEATQVFMEGWVDKWNILYTYKGILFTLTRKKILTHATRWMNFED